MHILHHSAHVPHVLQVLNIITTGPQRPPFLHGPQNPPVLAVQNSDIVGLSKHASFESRRRIAQVLRDEKSDLIPPPESEVVPNVPHFVPHVKPHDGVDEEKTEHEQEHDLDNER